MYTGSKRHGSQTTVGSPLFFPKKRLAFACVLAAAISTNAFAASCPPPSLELDGITRESDSCTSDSTTTSDADYGPTQIVNNSCPGIPSTFRNTTFVANTSEFNAAYESAQPGDAIVIRNGTYSDQGSVRLNRNGNAQNKIYILSESLHGARMRPGFLFNITGSHHVVAGLDWLNASVPFTVNGPDNRLACNNVRNRGGGGIFLETNSKGVSDRMEVDNNEIENLFKGLIFNSCNVTQPNCLENSMDIHVHHNAFLNRAPDPDTSEDHEAISIGLGFHEVPGRTNFNADRNDMRMVVENNLFDGWNGEEELISVKKSRNTIRNNCVVNAPNTYFNIRLGDNNLVTGNWHNNSRGSIRVSGSGNYVVFNYQSNNGGFNSAFEPHQGNTTNDGTRMSYLAASNSVLTNNVFSRYRGLINLRDRLGASNTHLESPSGIVFRDNIMFSDDLVGNNAANSGSYRNNDSTWTEAQFRANNTWGENRIVNSDLPDAACGTKSAFDGIGTSVPGNSALPGSPTVINAPSWWKAN